MDKKNVDKKLFIQTKIVCLKSSERMQFFIPFLRGVKGGSANLYLEQGPLSCQIVVAIILR